MSSLEERLEDAKRRLSSLDVDDPEYEKAHDEVHRLATEAYYLRMNGVKQ